MTNTAQKLNKISGLISEKKNAPRKKLRKVQDSSEIAQRYDLSLLTEKEELYFRMMFSQQGVLYLMSEPGLAKSSIARSIAKKLDMNYIDIRLSMIDETDLGLFPDKIAVDVQENGKTVSRNFLTHIVPLWAAQANEKPTFIHFEELNRAPLAVRNAALQILLERCIGNDFVFNKDVFMMASGNLGDEDGTDVEELDSALLGRLLPWRHSMNLVEWKESWADDNIVGIILDYLTSHPDHFYIQRNPEDEPTKVCPTPRNWTFLSKMLEVNYGYNTNPMDYASFVSQVGHAYIGACTPSFVQYCKDVNKTTIQDVISDYRNFEKKGIKLEKPKRSELLTRLRKIDLTILTDYEVENVKLFLLDIRADETTAFLIKVMDNDVQTAESMTDESESSNQILIDFLSDDRFANITDVILEKLENI